MRYVAGPTDASLESHMPVGTRIRKDWGRLGYERDGQWIGFPAGFYLLFLAVALGCFLFAAFRWRRSQCVTAVDFLNSVVRLPLLALLRHHKLIRLCPLRRAILLQNATAFAARARLCVFADAA